ncbi:MULTISPECIES: hypothetical protein [Aquimarina]|nr:MULTISPECIES: hypothetical protein [Aquimarina]
MPTIAILIQGLIWLGIFITLVYLIVRRIKIKGTEDFEDRDN